MTNQDGQRDISTLLTRAELDPSNRLLIPHNPEIESESQHYRLTIQNGVNSFGPLQIGFPARSVIINNFSDQWFYADFLRSYIPSFTFGMVANLPQAQQSFRLLLEGSIGQFNVGGGWIELIFFSKRQPPSPGIRTPDRYTPNGAVFASGANAQLQVGVGPVTGLISYLDGFDVTGLGATATSDIQITVSNIAPSGNVIYSYNVPAGITANSPSLQIRYPPNGIGCINPVNSIQITVPPFGAGNTLATLMCYGHYLPF